MPAFWKTKKFWGVLLALVMLAWSLYDLNLTQIGLIARRVRYLWVLLAVPVVIGVLWVRSARWRVLVNPIKAVGAGRMFSIYAVGQLANLLFPVLAGQAIRMVLLHRSEGVTKTGAVSTMMLETLLDGLSLLLFMMGASAALVLPDWLQHGERLGAILVLGVFALFILAVLNRQAVARAVQRLESHLPAPIFVRIDRIWTNFSEGLSALTSMRHLTVAFFLSVTSWLGNLAIISFMLYAFGLTLPSGAALVLMIVNAILMIVPITPANVGTYQVACVIGLSLFGVSKTDGVSFGLVLQATTILPIAAMGIYQYLRHSWPLREAQIKAELDELDRTSP